MDLQNPPARSGWCRLERAPQLSAIFPGTAGNEHQRMKLIKELERLAA